MRKTKEASAKDQDKDPENATYVLPSVLGYSCIDKKKLDEDSDSDSELFLMNHCDDCKTLRRDVKQKTKVCVLM